MNGDDDIPKSDGDFSMRPLRCVMSILELDADCVVALIYAFFIAIIIYLF